MVMLLFLVCGRTGWPMKESEGQSDRLCASGDARLSDIVDGSQPEELLLQDTRIPRAWQGLANGGTYQWDVAVSIAGGDVFRNHS